MILIKFWMHISDEEQLKRFKRREKDPLKQLEADRRGLAQPREALGYEKAVEDMLERTDHELGALAARGGRLQALRAGEGGRDGDRRGRVRDARARLRAARVRIRQGRRGFVTAV